ncbi:hypothetical protein VTP01DRAFT_5840 [Rhizomucor pusillus]|uniref:uncharacterized protein n=1 Tax=Rhizomucor pusillus TaxID=4840 RepID=UPI00374497A2
MNQRVQQDLSDDTRSLETLSHDRNLSEDRDCTDSLSSVRTEQVPSLQDDLVVQSHEGQITKYDLANCESKKTMPTDEKRVDDDFDGGYGWFVVIGAFMVQFTAFSTASCWARA